MASTKMRNIENLIMLTFPLVLFAGCAGSDIKPVHNEPVELKSTEYDAQDQSYSYIEPDEPTVTALKSNPVVDDITPKDEDVFKSVEESSFEPQESLKQTGIVITPEKKIFFFETNIFALSEEQQVGLKQHAEYLIANPGAVLVINGHADVRGTENYNQNLSEKRANETLKFFIDQGVPKDQLLAKGFGELVPMNEENNWDENRRVELQYTDPVMLSSM